MLPELECSWSSRVSNQRKLLSLRGPLTTLFSHSREGAEVGCLRQALGPGALGKPRGSRWRGRWEGGSGWGTHVNPWLFHSNVLKNSLKKKKKKKEGAGGGGGGGGQGRGILPCFGFHLTVLSSLLADHSNLENDAVCSNFRGALAPLCPLL